jgi:hypothetical protein
MFLPRFAQPQLGLKQTILIEVGMNHKKSDRISARIPDDISVNNECALFQGETCNLSLTFSYPRNWPLCSVQFTKPSAHKPTDAVECMVRRIMGKGKNISRDTKFQSLTPSISPPGEYRICWERVHHEVHRDPSTNVDLTSFIRPSSRIRLFIRIFKLFLGGARID